MYRSDTPELFGMHVNADITFRNKQTNELLTTIIDTQPKAAGGGGGLSVEDVACNMVSHTAILLAPSLFFIWKTLVFIERCVGEWCVVLQIDHASPTAQPRPALIGAHS